MDEVFTYLLELLSQTLREVTGSLLHNWKVLTFSILLAVGLKTYMNTEKFSKVLFRRKKLSIIASVLFGAFTPLCACGTTAVLIGMLTTTLPWGPIMAFLTSSPLMSPDGFVFITGVVGLRFAIALTIASIAIGIGSGLITNIIEKKTGFLVDQSRYLGAAPPSACACATPLEATSCSCGSNNQDEVSQDNTNEVFILGEGGQLCCTQVKKSNHLITEVLQKMKLKELLKGIYELGLKQILLFYSIFIAVGYLINYFIPTSIISVLFGAKSFFAVPLASLIGLPLYLTTGAGVPIIQSMLESGASEGAMLAFMITGSATSAWVIAGLATFMKKRAIILYVSFVLVGGIIAGYIFDFIGLL